MQVSAFGCFDHSKTQQEAEKEGDQKKLQERHIAAAFNEAASQLNEETSDTGVEFAGKTGE